ncbi:MAG TPA: maleylpyruvate isomerase family mycothiol-dependent enzyme [Candidatus Saccharimonadia bacterium]
MQTTKSELKDSFIAERKQLVALVESVSDEQLDQPSLCDGWSGRNVLGHIIGFELSLADVFLLIFKLKSLNDINGRQAKRYEHKSRQAYITLLRRGLRRTLFLVSVTPSGLLNRKFIHVPNGRISIGQLYGDAAMDRAVHYLDIASPLGVSSEVTEAAAMRVSVKFVLSCVDLLNPKIPRVFYGRYIKLELTGLCAGVYYWKIGTDWVTDSLDEPTDVALTAKGSTNDMLFTITSRPTLLKKQLAVTGDKELEKIIRKSFNANALWEG